MTNKITRTRRVALALSSAVGLLSGCSGHPRAQAEGGSVAAESVRATPIPVALGPGIHVTRTDSASVARAAAYRLDKKNFAAYMAAADSLYALVQRDSVVRNYLDVTVSDAGAPTADAGRRWLEANDKVSHAITSSGLSVSDYYVASIAVANAEYELLHPTATPAANAEFVRTHTVDLARLHRLHRLP
jgi:hypothetical protein